jgi:phosphatidylserine/phosphatidylglycerophosphate/cardiolipin synthase-like enzyme
MLERLKQEPKRFAPEQNCQLYAIGVIDGARSEILVNAYALTAGSGIPGALIRAHDRGADVRVIADKWTPCENREGLTPLAAAGIPVWIDARARIAHEKADHRPHGNGDGQPQLVRGRGVHQRGHERSHVARSGSGLRNTLAKQAERRGTLRQCG